MMTMQRGILILTLIACALAVHADEGAWGDQGDGTYANPILPADYSDLDVIRVADEYYAISSTMQFSPGMVILASRDLVNWRIVGHAVKDVTRIGPEMNWDRMGRYGRGVWAGAIRHHDGKFWIYFGTPDEGYFMTTAANAAGPWEPLHQVMKAPGWDDCCPFWDDDGQGYLIGSHFKDNYKTHLFKLTTDGKQLVEGFDRVLHESKGREANKLYKWNGLYYHFFSEVRPEGRVPMMGRARKITGPYEYRQIAHVNSRLDREPNQGGVVQVGKDDWWFVTHLGTGAYEGRPMCLLPVTWRDGWPIIGEIGADGIGSMLWRATKPIKGFPAVAPQMSDEFNDPALGVQWEWNHQPRDDKWSLTERPGWLRLHAFTPLKPGDFFKAGNTLTQRSLRSRHNEITICMDISGMADGQRAGLCHFGARSSLFGVEQTAGKRSLICEQDGKLTVGPAITTTLLWLQSTWHLDGRNQYAYSLEGQAFSSFGELYQLNWGNYRGDRIGIFSCNGQSEGGHIDVDWFHYKLNEPSSSTTRRSSK